MPDNPFTYEADRHVWKAQRNLLPVKPCRLLAPNTSLCERTQVILLPRIPKYHGITVPAITVTKPSTDEEKAIVPQFQEQQQEQEQEQVQGKRKGAAQHGNKWVWTGLTRKEKAYVCLGILYAAISYFGVMCLIGLIIYVIVLACKETADEKIVPLAKTAMAKYQ